MIFRLFIINKRFIYNIDRELTESGTVKEAFYNIKFEVSLIIFELFKPIKK